MRITAARVRELYPNPRVAHNPLPEDVGIYSYCVGGALLRSMGCHQRYEAFPSIGHLAQGLVMANGKLTYAQATNASRRIVGFNDVGDFEGAWNALAEALDDEAPCERRAERAPEPEEVFA